MTSQRLADLVRAFQERLYIPDPTPLYAVLATVVANRAPGAPLWLMLVGAPGSGKTEILQSLSDLSDVYATGELTLSGLLSGVSARDRDQQSTGGLLRQIGEFGIILCKDFGTVLSMHREGRQAVLAALREVFDGSYVRRLGTDGGRTFEWKGKAGFLGGCTEEIDRHHAVMSLMGERFLLCRMPSARQGEFDEFQLMRAARSNAGRMVEVQDHLREAVGAFLGALDIAALSPVPGLDEREERALYALASLVARARSALGREGHSRVVELIPDSEVPTRVVVQIERLRFGLLGIGLSAHFANRVLRKVALDSIPRLKRDVLCHLSREPEQWRALSDLTSAMRYPEQTLRRTLEDLEAHDVVTCRRHGHKYEWRPSDWARERLADIATGFPEASEHFSSVPDSSEDTSSVPEMSSLQELEGRQIGKVAVGTGEAPSDAAGKAVGSPDISGTTLRTIHEDSAPLASSPRVRLTAEEGLGAAPPEAAQAPRPLPDPSKGDETQGDNHGRS